MQNTSNALTTVENSSKSKPNLLRKKFVLFGGVGFLALFFVVLLALLLTPFKLNGPTLLGNEFKIDEDTARERMLSNDEVEWPLTIDGMPYNSLEDGTFFFDLEATCGADSGAASLLSQNGRIMESRSFRDSSNGYNANYLEEILVEFENSAQALEFVGFARSGYHDDACRKKDNLIGVAGKSLYGQSGGRSLSGLVGGDEASSFGFMQETHFYSRFPNNDSHWERHVSLAAKGKYVVMVVATFDVERPTELSANTLKSFAEIAIKKIFK